jgi:amino acid adenylation domain-containing protein
MIATTIHLIEKQVALTPDKIAVSFNDKKISYSELNRKANRMANYFISRGISKGVVVGIAIDRSVDLLVSLLAVFKVGAAYVPLDPDYPNQRLEYMLNDSQAGVLLTNLKYKNDLETSVTKVILEEVQPLLDDHQEVKSEIGHNSEASHVVVNSNDLAYILYTSGSTGHPKGVMIEHGNLVNLIQSVQKFPGLGSDDKLLSLTTMSFDISVLEFFLPLTVGATLYLADADFAKDGEAILALIKKENISFMQATPSTYKMMLAAEWDHRCDIKVICCGEQLPKDLADKILSKCARLFNMYGPTETTIYSTGKEIIGSDNVITIGKPIDNTEVFILDHNQQLLDIGQSGEIYIAGKGVARGYFGKPELTSERFISWVHQDNALRLYRTGDLGQILDNGEIQCFGRVDDQIKIRGYRIEIGEIEYALLRQNNVKEALITSWTGPSGDPRIAAYVVTNHRIPKKDLVEAFASWKQSLRSLLPFYMIPNDFILIDTFPLLENGKIDRKKLPPPSISSLQVVDDAIPRSFFEIMIAKVWADNLGIDNIGIHDNFFDLGGHSLTAVKVIVQIKKASGKYLPLGSLFNNRTIAKLAVMLEDEQEKSNFSCLVPLKPTGTKAPLYIVHGLGSTVFKFYDFANQLDDQQPVFGFQAKGVDGIDKPAESIEAMASEYVAELLKNIVMVLITYLVIPWEEL